MIVIDTAGSLYAGGLVIHLIFPQIPIWQSIIAIAIISGLYTIAGGLAAVVFTDAIQAVVLTIGATLIAVIAYNRHLGGSDRSDPTRDAQYHPAAGRFLPAVARTTNRSAAAGLLFLV